VTPQQRTKERTEQERQKELDRIVLLTGLLILAFCILAYLQDGVDGLFVAVLLSVGTVCGFVFYGVTAARRR
jgi:uncharacterized membrane-anchored protein